MSQPVKRTVSLTPDPAYWQALGEFVEAFAHIEHFLFNGLTLASGVSPRVAKALFSGTRALDAISLLRRISEISPPSANRDELEDVFAQITAINMIRNSIVHYASIMTSDSGRITTNWARALTPERIAEHRISPDMLKDMSADLDKAGNHFVSLWTLGSLTLAQRAEELPPLARAWRYKRPQGDSNQSRKSGQTAKRDRRTP